MWTARRQATRRGAAGRAEHLRVQVVDWAGLEHGTGHPGDGAEAATVQEEVGARTARWQEARRGEAAAVSREDRKTSSEKRAELETSEELSGRRGRKMEISRKMGMTSTAVCEPKKSFGAASQGEEGRRKLPGRCA